MYLFHKTGTIGARGPRVEEQAWANRKKGGGTENCWWETQKRGIRFLKISRPALGLLFKANEYYKINLN